MSISFDRREINNQVFLIQFEFQSYGANSNGSQSGLSLDKYLGIDVWSQIYKKLDAIVQAYQSDVDKSLKDTLLYVGHSQLELDVSLRSCGRTFQKDVARHLKDKGCEKSCEKVLIVKVRMVSALDKFRKLHNLDKAVEKKSAESINCEPGTSGTGFAAADNRSWNGSSSQSEKVEEYVPEPVSDISNNLKYTPSTLSNSAENVVPNVLDVNVCDDVYTPSQKNGSNDSQIISYTPTKIAHTSQATDLNRNDCTSKKIKRIKSKNKLKNIFGGESGDEGIDDDNPIRLRRDLRSSPHKTQMKSNKFDKQGRLDGWVNTRKSRSDAKRDCDQADYKKKVRKMGMNERSDSVKKEMNEAEKLRYLREEFEEMDDVNEIGVHINLKDMDIEEIVKTFAEHKPALLKLYRSNQKTLDHRYEPVYNYLTILDTLLDQNQQQKMYLKIKNEFDREADNHITSKHENLFWKGLLPEWALLIFMEKFVLDRKEAITRLTNQDNEKVQKDFPFDLDL